MVSNKVTIRVNDRDINFKNVKELKGNSKEGLVNYVLRNYPNVEVIYLRETKIYDKNRIKKGEKKDEN